MCFEADLVKHLSFQNPTIHSLYRIPWFDYLNELKSNLFAIRFTWYYGLSLVYGTKFSFFPEFYGPEGLSNHLS